VCVVESGARQKRWQQQEREQRLHIERQPRTVNPKEHNVNVERSAGRGGQKNNLKVKVQKTGTCRRRRAMNDFFVFVCESFCVWTKRTAQYLRKVNLPYRFSYIYAVTVWRNVQFFKEVKNNKRKKLACTRAATMSALDKPSVRDH